MEDFIDLGILFLIMHLLGMLINHFRAVRAMNETLKQNRLLRERGDDSSYVHSPNDGNTSSDLQKNVNHSYHMLEHILYFGTYMNIITMIVN